VANARITGLAGELARQDTDIKFLRELLQKAVGWWAAPSPWSVEHKDGVWVASVPVR
jgi:hypothetical protein